MTQLSRFRPRSADQEAALYALKQALTEKQSASIQLEVCIRLYRPADGTVLSCVTFPLHLFPGEKDLLFDEIAIQARERFGLPHAAPLSLEPVGLERIDNDTFRLVWAFVPCQTRLPAMPEADGQIPQREYEAFKHIETQKEAACQKLPQALIPWYRDNARALPWRADREPYHVWLSEIMLQQTRVEAVRDYYTRFLSALPDIAALAAAPEEQLLKLWEGLGYYNRARNLQKAARVIMEQYHGVFPNTQAEILSLPGIGGYTAGAIASICFGLPTPAVDGNVRRVVSRVTEQYGSIDLPFVKQETADRLAAVYPGEDCGAFTQSLMELGATVCLPNGAPKCGICPAAAFCLARRGEVADQIPRRQKKKARRVEHMTVFLLRCGGRTAVRKRRDAGLLASLWEFPHVPGHLEAADALSTARGWNLIPQAIERVAHYRHIFTHVQWEMRCYFLSCTEQGESPFTWADEQALESQIALPSAFKQILEPPENPPK
ncbi:MAG: A/G-specific adenine glycosylase [Clostridiales bacterium]|nr:A/G-specific adenine glycosylase [Clostridiales bacterium]